ncbi:MAG: BREX-1 system adenine-specific DNA-methyltransferase PglX [Peptococcaceae bacterium]|nr:BREX-1 system adenine-specific DNA-methyltransferase PglX [Peptococcaceae bacterium]
MDKEARNKIRKMVEEIRRLLEEDVSLQLEGTYGITPKTIHDEGDMPVLRQYLRRLAERRSIIAAIEYEESYGLKKSEAVDKFARETVFTWLNRLAALRMMEARKLISESISRYTESAGFKLFKRVCPEVCRGHDDEGYRVYLELIFDEMAADVPDLFDRGLPYSIVFPSSGVLKNVIGLFNQAPPDIWLEDETLGWVYQYFTPKELREKLRKESQAPRNSYELALRNQFYTPSYVVRFLTDNTLGRLWYESNPGTILAEKCAYLVKRPGEEMPARKKIDPREIKVLDPACGSGHYLLYAFDVLAAIYGEEGFERSEIPGLILKYNLYGIDIDPRAVQIAALALYLKAKSYDPGARVDRARVACAGPMPGDRDMFEEFLKKVGKPTLRRLAEKMSNVLELAGEVGSLLKAEQDLKEIIREGRNEYDAGLARSLFPEYDRPRQPSLVFPDVDEEFWETADREIMDIIEQYTYEFANGRDVKKRLFGYDARQGVEFIKILRQKFDVVLMNPPFGEAVKKTKTYMEKHYLRTRNDVYAAFVERGLELIKPGGFLGAITSRTGFFLTTFSRWREEILLPLTGILAVADLGFGVLDNAMVETAAYVLSKPKRQGQSSVFFRLLKTEDKAGRLRECVQNIAAGDEDEAVHLVDQDTFRMIPGSPFPYWVSDDMRRKFVDLPPFEGNGGEVRQGLATADDFRFVRAVWEVSPHKIGQGRKWVPFAKGGEYSPYYDDIHLVVNWENDGIEIKNFKDQSGKLLSRPQNTEYYFKYGLTYPLRTTKGLSVRVMPEGCIFSHKGPAILSSREKCLYNLGLVNSRIFETFVTMRVGAADAAARSYEVGLLQTIPYVKPIENITELVEVSDRCHKLKRSFDFYEETSHLFIQPLLTRFTNTQLHLNYLDSLEEKECFELELIKYTLEIDKTFLNLYNINQQDKLVLDIEFGKQVFEYEDNPVYNDNLFEDAYYGKINLKKQSFDPELEETDESDQEKKGRSTVPTIEELSHFFKTHPRIIAEKRRQLGLYRPEELAEETANLLMYAVGCAFGRWDVRIGKDPSLAPPLPELFDPLPVCSPGMLVGPDGLPARETPAGYPVKIRWDGVLTDDEGHHSDIVAAVREVLQFLFREGDPAAIEQEACQILGVRDLRTWLVNKFFPFHIKRYSKSRRKAPVYWQLRSTRKNYSVFLYYHRITKDTLFHVVRSYVDPKIEYERGKLEEFKGLLESSKGQGRQERTYSRLVEEKAKLLEELSQFRESILEVAGMGYDPDMDDGVLINIAPLYKLVPWNDAEKTWRELKEGMYGWSSMSRTMIQKVALKG